MKNKILISVSLLIFAISYANAQYIEHICPKGLNLYNQSRLDESIDELHICLINANDNEDSLLIQLNIAKALIGIKKYDQANIIIDSILSIDNSKLYKSKTLAYEWKASPYMMRDKNLYLSYLMKSDSVATASNFRDGMLRAKVSIGNAYYTLFRQLDIALDYFTQSLAIENIPDDYYLSTVSAAYDSSFKLGKGNTDSLYHLGIQYIEKIKTGPISAKDSSSVGTFFGVVANNFISQGNLRSALDHNLKAIKYKPKAKKHQYGLCRLYYNTARIFQSLSNYEKAHEYTDILEVIVESNNFKSLIKDTKALRGNTYLKEGNLEMAKSSYLSFLKLNEDSKIKQNSVLITALGDLSNIYIQQDSLTLAKQYLDKGQLLIKNTKEGNSHMNLHASLANYYLITKNYNNAKEESTKLLNLSRKFNSAEYRTQALNFLSQSNYQLGDFNAAYINNIASSVLKDSVFRAEQNYLVHDLEAKYFKKEQDLEIDKLQSQELISKERLSSQRKIITLGGIGLGLISVLSFFLYKQRQKISDQHDVIKYSLSEKELLLKEIHHRVKNNLQVVSSLLSLQSEYISDDSALSAINEGRNRVRSMALIHQNLYAEDNLTGINVKSYLEKLIEGLFDSYNIEPENIKLDMNIANIDIDVDTLVPLGLIANELVSNALKHAFTSKSTGMVWVSLTHDENHLNLTIKDNGKGIDPKINLKDSESFGYQMIDAFKVKLDAQLKIETEGGTSVELVLPKNKMNV